MLNALTGSMSSGYALHQVIVMVEGERASQEESQRISIDLE